jgi:aldose 1-epimerase
MNIQELKIQNLANPAIKHFELKNGKGTSVKITNIGATITSIVTPDKNGNPAEISLGFDDPAHYLSKEYLGNCPFLGAVVGRFANRIANGRFTLDGKTYTLATNNGPNHLHGGPAGYFLKIWDSSIEGDTLVFKLFSPDNDEGYPGNVNVKVSYKLTEENELIIHYFAEADQATPVNLTNHAYFNLSGKKGNILDHEVMILADHYTPAIEAIPTGEIASVKNTPFDFTSFHRIGERIAQLPENTYDHNFALNLKEGELSRAAVAKEAVSGRVLEVFTTLPGMQFYAGYYLDGSHSRSGRKFESFEGFCFETQYFPDSPNKANFPDCITKPGKPFDHTTVFKFSTEQ